MRITLLESKLQQNLTETEAAFGQISLPRLPFNKYNTKPFPFGWTRPAVHIDPLQIIPYLYIFPIDSISASYRFNVTFEAQRMSTDFRTLNLFCAENGAARTAGNASLIVTVM